MHEKAEKEAPNAGKADIDDQFNLEELSEITKLLLRINAYGKSRFQRSLDTREAGKDKKTFEIDLNYFVDWFRKNEYKLKEKMDFFYGPYLNDIAMIENTRKRKV